MNNGFPPSDGSAPDIALALDALSAEWGEASRAIAESLSRGALERERIHDWVDRAYLQFLHGLTARYLVSDKTGPAARERLTKLRSHLAERLAALGELLPEPSDPANGGADAVSFTHQVTSLLWSASQSAANGSPQPDAPVAKEVTAGSAANLAPAFNALYIAIQQAGERAGDAAAQIEAVRIALDQSRPDWDARELREVLLDAARELLTVNTDLSRQLEEIRARASDTTAVPAPTVTTSSAPAVASRDAFLRALALETERARRYGQPLSVAIIRPASPPGMNPFVGTGAARQVLRSYSEHVFARLRVCDIVGQHDRASFALALPNTDGEQALDALRKIQTHAASAHFVYAGRRRPVPWFYGGVTAYAHGESPATVLARAERALRRARHYDAHRIEIETPPGASRR
jgi:GGDEF domain-containing protein